VVALRALGRSFGPKVAVADLDLQVFPGEFFAFLGPNGAGKSTTIKIATAMLRPTAGYARVLGFDVVAHPLEVKRRIGVLPEEVQLYERLTPLETLRFAGALYGLRKDEIASRSAELLDLLEIAAADRRKMVVDFSMGMRKKVALACALLHAPRLLFLDEPFNGIDAVTTRAIKDVLQQAVGRGVTIFFSSHILEQVERLCTRIGVIDHGRLKALGTLPELRAASGMAPDASLEDVFVRLVGAERDARRTLRFLG
ncbi:MAG TPA: ABC transporter ATP-binding protein, partial [Planctomycetota bacterium]|nr:ABC transporter ATP-binding protein [Planctomycetota bacterium]